MLTKLNQAAESLLSVVVTSATTLDKSVKLLEKEVDLLSVKQETRMSAARAEYADAISNLQIEL